MVKRKLKNVSHSFYSDLSKEMKNEVFKKEFQKEKLKLEIAEKVIELRKKKNVSQSELAQRINTTQAVISRIENAQVFPSTRLIYKIAAAFDVEVSFDFV